MKIAYITAYTPFGRGETFILEEMEAVIANGVDLTIIPKNPPKDIFHKAGVKLKDKTICLPLLNLAILRSFLRKIHKAAVWDVLRTMLYQSRSLKIFLKNLAILPKAVHISKLIGSMNIGHLHAHWGSTTATMTWIISKLTNIPWSMTLHRWDITENNLMKIKVAQASFVRCISESGLHEVLELVGNEYEHKLILIHMGVSIPTRECSSVHSTSKDMIFACPANLLPVKGHRYLIKAFRLLKDMGINNYQCLFIGDGPLANEILQNIIENHLQEVVKPIGSISHERLMEMYRKREINAVVLPSIITEDGEKEGIPVSLMEAMAHGIPVISTRTGGIPELLSEGAGLLVDEKNSGKLASTLFKFLSDPVSYRELSDKGYKRVVCDFNSEINVRRLISMMASHTCMTSRRN